MSPRASAPALAALLLAGCLSAYPPPPADEGPGTGGAGAPETGGAAPVVVRHNGTAQGALLPGGGFFNLQGDNGVDVEVLANATAIVVEMAWTGPEALDLAAFAPPEYCTPTDPAGVFGDCPDPPPDTDGSSPARVDILDAEHLALVGTWNAAGFTHVPSGAPVAFTLAASVFYGPPPDPAYSALPPGPAEAPAAPRPTYL